MSEYEETQDSEKLSKYNSAIDQLRRIDEIYRHIIKNKRDSNFYLWNLNLDCIWSELVGDFEEKAPEEEKMISLNKKILEVSPLFSSAQTSFNKIPSDFITKKSQQYLALFEKEIFIRRVQNKLGKGTAWSSGDEDDFE